MMVGVAAVWHVGSKDRQR